jgi:hypothetical protein
MSIERMLSVLPQSATFLFAAFRLQRLDANNADCPPSQFQVPRHV